MMPCVSLPKGFDYSQERELARKYRDKQQGSVPGSSHAGRNEQDFWLCRHILFEIDKYF